MLHCPKCGDLIKETRNGSHICERGQMELSQNVYESLIECFVEKKREPKPSPKKVNFRIGGTWFCPGCGIQIIEYSPGKLICTNCNKELWEFIHQLVELHPHLKV